MIEFIHCLQADFIKIKRRPVLWIHFLIPIVGISILLLIFAFSKQSPGLNALDCLGAIALSFPTLIAIVCSMIGDQETEAGNYQQLLTNPSKLRPFLSLSALLLLLGSGAVLLAALGFEAGFAVILHHVPIGPEFYLSGAAILFSSNIFLYFLHLFLSFRFNKGVSISIGIVESLLSALLITGLGDGKWMFIPCAWVLHFLKVFGITNFGGSMPTACGLRTGIVLCVLETLLIFVFSIIWFLSWEGKRAEE
ncbi:ABC-2 family transporter protein [Desulfosporosinus acididurans]|uniref:ABC-2 family transporter protein n=1 Tax=Desulfosporosinus acididurans TaxID=476652 RepID=A0A0J1FKT2_9FIRM|nr:lantibiotic immunity ABC transporter MutG family permease subunit [Desulfosporosinus acididurans]KLU64100.1 ABC-2 family transporter protein [Desulfosporosinus acididurans]